MARQRSERSGRGVLLAAAAMIVLAAGSVGYGCTAPGGDRPSRTTAGAGRSAAGSATAGPSPARTSPGPSMSRADTDPARFAPSVIRYARVALVNPQLLMAILYNEAYKPHDPAVERAWQRLKPDAAFGIANMHRATFDEIKQGRDFADRDWEELPDDPDLAIEAAAWYLHDLAGQLPGHWSGPYTRDELLALGYNAGPGSMAAFADGANPGPVTRSYLERLRANWERAGLAVNRGG